MAEVTWAADGSDAAVAALLARVIKRPGRVTLCLPGGATPVPVFKALAAMRLPWEQVTIVPGDERQVPYDHPASNFGLLRAAFGATGATIEPLSLGMSLPRFALVWLGLGMDGHMASLFPSSDPDASAPSQVIDVTPEPLPPRAPFSRLTLTLAALADADGVIIVARGAKKRQVIEAALAGADLPLTRLFAMTPVELFWCL